MRSMVRSISSMIVRSPFGAAKKNGRPANEVTTWNPSTGLMSMLRKASASPDLTFCASSLLEAHSTVV